MHILAHAPSARERLVHLVILTDRCYGGEGVGTRAGSSRLEKRFLRDFCDTERSGVVLRDVLHRPSLHLLKFLAISCHALILPFYPFVLWPCIKFYPLLTISSSRHLPLSNLNAPTHTKIPSARFHITIPLRTCQSLGHVFQTKMSDVLRRRKYILNALE